VTAFANGIERIDIGPTVDSGGSGGTSVQLLTASTHAQSFIFSSETTDAITRGAIRVSFGSGTPATHVMSLRNVDVSANAARAGSTVHASQTFTPNTSAASYEVTFSSSYTPSLGELLCLDVRYSSGTINGSNYIAPIIGMVGRGVKSFPFSTYYNGSSWQDYTSGTCTFAYGTASQWYGEPAYGLSQTSTISTNGHRAACKFQIPPQYATLDVVGFEIMAQPSISASQSADIVLLSGSTELLTRTYDSDALRNVQGIRRVMFSGTQTLNVATDYRIGFERNGTNLSLFALDVPATHRTAYSGGTNNCYSSWNGSAWTDDTTKIVPMALLCSGYTLASSGGGGRLIGNSNLVSAA